MPKSDGLVDQPTHIVLAADVGTQKVGLRAELAQLGDHPFVFVVASTGHDDASAFGREGACRRAADTRERAGDQYDRGLHEMLLGMGPTDRTGSVRKPNATTVPPEFPGITGRRGSWSSRSFSIRRNFGVDDEWQRN